MAYLVEIKSECNEYGCSKQAVVMLRSWQNATIGEFCRTHGKSRLARAKKIEQDDTRRG